MEGKSPDAWWIRPGLSFGMLGIFAAAGVAIFWRGEESLINGYIDAVKMLTVGVFGYWIGSSAGSAKKTDLLATVPPSVAPAPAAPPVATPGASQ